MSQNEFQDFLLHISSDPITLLDPKFNQDEFVRLDLSTENPDLKELDLITSESLDGYISEYINSKNAKVGYGGYNEKRDIYSRSENFNNGNDDDERNIHIGLDLWVPAGTKVYAPFTGKVHSYRNNAEVGDYGPTIILEHKMEEFVFYTLYGHLSLDSLEQILEQQIIKEGKKIGEVGDSSVNGDYPPHLHFQIIRDMEGLKGDYPGVCSKKNLDYYLQNCPDPNLILKIEN